MCTISLYLVNKLSDYKSSSSHFSVDCWIALSMGAFCRYILVDWLLEVAEMKEFPSATVHLAVSLLDRYLLRRKIQKTQLQLLGITALVLASR